MTQTDETGHFQISDLGPGHYDVWASAARLQRIVKQIEVKPGEDASVEFVLTPSPVVQSVTVAARPDSNVSPEAATATKVTAPLTDVPQSIQVVNRRIIEDQQAIEIGDAVRNVSGVTRASTDDAG